MRIRTFTYPFGKYIELNPFGDYTALVLTVKDDDGEVTREWSLISERGPPPCLLTESKAHRALESLFIKYATVCDVPVVAT